MKNNLTTKNEAFKPPLSTLKSLTELLNFTSVSNVDLEIALERWIYKPPIKRFTNILSSSEVALRAEPN